MFIFPPEHSKVKLRGAFSTLPSSSTQTKAMRGNQIISEIPPIDDRQEKKTKFPTNSRVRKTMIQF